MPESTSPRSQPDQQVPVWKRFVRLVVAEHVRRLAKYASTSPPERVLSSSAEVSQEHPRSKKRTKRSRTVTPQPDP